MTAWVLAAVLGLMTRLVPVSEHAFREPRAVTEARYEAFAVTVAGVAFDESEAPLPGLSRTRTALVLAAIAARESSFRGDVMSCDVYGMGKAAGPFQAEALRYRGRACGSWESATRLALEMAAESMTICARSPLADRLAFYTDGPASRCGSPWQRSRVRMMPALLAHVAEGST